MRFTARMDIACGSPPPTGERVPPAPRDPRPRDSLYIDSSCLAKYGARYTTRSHVLHVLDEPEVFCHLVVQRAARSVGSVREPVHPLAARFLRDVVHGHDQRAADAVAALVRVREQVLQITDVLDTRGAAVKEVVAQAEHLAVALRYDAVHRLAGIEETAPCRLRDLVRKRGRAGTLVEGVVFVPERFPGVVVIGFDRPNRRWLALPH